MKASAEHAWDWKRYRTLYHCFLDTDRQAATSVALMGGATDLTYRDVAWSVRALAAALIDLKVARGDRVVILCANRPEWVIADLAAQAAGAVVVPLPPALEIPQLTAILAETRPGIVFTDNASLDHLLTLAPAVRETFAAISCEAETPLEGGQLAVHWWEDVIRRGCHFPYDEQFAQRLDEANPTDLASIVYTSPSDRVNLTHAGILARAAHLVHELPVAIDDVVVSLAPLSQIAQRALSYAVIAVGARAWYGSGDDRTLRAVHPTLVSCTDLAAEGLYHGLLASQGSDGWRRRLHVTLPVAWPMTQVAERVVFPRSRRWLGGQVRTIFGSGPLHSTTVTLFEALGIRVVEEPRLAS